MLLIFAIASVASVVGYRLYRMVMNTPIPQQTKLIDCTNAVATCSFTPRVGYSFNMVMVEQCQFTGRVQILRGMEHVADLEIDSDKMKQCNWLQTKGIPEAWILTWDLGLERYLDPGKEHRLVFSFQKPFPTNASIWMTWLERAGNFRRK